MNAEIAQKYARITGALLLLSILAGGFGEAYVPFTLVVTGDANERLSGQIQEIIEIIARLSGHEIIGSDSISLNWPLHNDALN